jgi:N-acetylmuramoyl-L-alanine amidase
MTYNSIVISSGHGLHVPGAHGLISEVDEARMVVDRVAEELRAREVAVVVFHDNTSTTQSENLDTIVDFHNMHVRDLDVSVHFNAFETTSKAMGTEVLYVTQRDLAADVSDAIANSAGLIDRGPKQRPDCWPAKSRGFLGCERAGLRETRPRPSRPPRRSSRYRRR